MSRLRRKTNPNQNPSQERGEPTGFSSRLVTVLDPSGAASESYRMLRTNLFYALVDYPPKVIVLTSAGEREGKSTTTANLGVTLAQAGKNTLILDCDLRKPVQHSVFGVRNLNGLANILIEKQRPREVWYEPVPGLKLIPAGPPPPNPAEILSSRRLAEFLNQMREEFDYVLVDTPPVETTSDAAVLAANGDGVLLVLDGQNTRKTSLRHAVHSLEGVGAKVLGTVMNNADASRSEYRHYGGSAHTGA